MSLLSFYRKSIPQPNATPKKSFTYYQWATFLSATLGYGIYYVCRLSINVVKKPIVNEGIFSETELGIIGSILFITYAVGKFTNGFFADRSNVKRLVSTGLLVTALANLALGFTSSFILFATLWGVSGWFQSMGAASCVVSLSRWFPKEKRGTYYGFWSASHNIGEALTFLVISAVVGALGWRYGFFSAGLIGIAGVIILWIFFKDSPESLGYPQIMKPLKTDDEHDALNKDDFNAAQKAVLKNPAIWILALSSAFMYISRYAVNSWGMFYLEAEKGYSIVEAGSIISISSVFGIIGTAFSGLISDKLFGGRRNLPALIFGIFIIVGLCMFLLFPESPYWVDAVAMLIFGTGIGVLICFLGGFMAVDIAPANASGAALGVVGIASYIGAAVQDVMSGIFIEGNKTMVNGTAVYDFTYINYFWIGAAVLSTILALFVWNAKKKV